VSGWLAAEYAARDVLVVAGAVIAVAAFLISALVVRDTADHVALEQANHADSPSEPAPAFGTAFADASYRRPALRSCSQAGLVNNLNDALAWGLVPLFLAAHGAGVASIGLVAALYPAVWSVAQIATGHWSDHVGRKPLIVAGMLVQAAALGLLALSDGAVGAAATSAVVLGLGTALVYPTLIAAMSDAVSPVARAPVVGVYRFWRDTGYVVGALIAGLTADALGYGGAVGIVAALTAASGLWVLIDMPPKPSPAHAARPLPAGGGR
jgi:MFS family permease